MCEATKTVKKEGLQYVNGSFSDPETGEIIEIPAHYLETFDKLHNLPTYKPTNKAPVPCLNGYISGKCNQGHQWAKAIYCDKEFCPDCGEKHSPIHQRRIARWFDKVMSFDSCAMVVVTIPQEAREYFLYNYDPTWKKQPKGQINRTPETETPQYKERKRVQGLLSAYRLALKRKLQKMGYDKGLSRWHWLGSCPDCGGEGCEGCKHTGAGYNFNPHLHFLVEGGHLAKDELNKLRLTLGNFARKWFKNNLFIDLPRPIVIHYSYGKDRDKKAHLLSYVTRATLRHEIEPIKETIYKYRTTSTWGKFEMPQVEAKDEGAQLENGRCPCCGEAVTWGQFTALKYWRYKKHEIVNLTCGYSKLPNEVGPAPPEHELFKLLNYAKN